MIKLSSQSRFVYEWSHTNPVSGVVSTSFAHPFGTKDVMVDFYIVNPGPNEHVHDLFFSGGIHDGITYSTTLTAINVVTARINNIPATFTIRAIVKPI